MLQQDASATWTGTRYTRSCSSQTRLYQPHLRWAWSKNLRAVLPRHVADGKAATAICSIAGGVFAFQQDNVPAHRAHDTVKFMRGKTPQFISPDLNPVNYGIWGMLQERVYRMSSTNPRYGLRTTCRSILLRHGLYFSRAWWTMQLISGEKGWKHVSVHEVVTLNTCCDVVCMTFQLPHITTGSFQSHQCQPTTGSFRSHQRFEERNITFSQLKKFCILQCSVVTFFRCGG